MSNLNKAGTKSPASRLGGLALNRAVGGVLSRPKLRKALSVNTESKLLKVVDGTSRVALDDFAMSKTPSLQRKDCNTSTNVLSFKLQASTSTEHEQNDSKAATGNEVEMVNKQAVANMECPKDNEMLCNDFNSKIRQLIQKILSSHLQSVEYNHETCGAKCKTISQMIESGVKSLYNVQYKITVVVYIGAVRDRGIEIASQCIWNQSTDSFAMATVENNTLFATGIVFATLFNDE